MREYHTFGEYIKLHELTPSEEDYIEMIYRIQLNNNAVKVVELANSLNVSKPSVSKMIKRLQGKDLLNHESYGDIRLNDRGEKVGQSLLDRHNTVEYFLKIIGVSQSLHDETEKIEHTISLETLECITSFVRFLENNDDLLKRYNEFINKNM